LLTASLFVFGRGGKGRINRLEGGVLVSVYVAYSCYLISTVAGG